MRRAVAGLRPAPAHRRARRCSRARPGHLAAHVPADAAALAIPTVLILLTMVFLLMRVAPGNPIQAALGGHVSQEEIDERSQAAGYDKPILDPVRRVPRRRGHAQPRHDADRPPHGHVDHRRERQRRPSSSPFCGVHDHARRRVSIGLLAGPLPRHLDRHRRPVVRDLHLRGPGVLPGLPAPAPLRQRPGAWLPTSGRASPIVEFELDKTTHFYLIDSLIPGNWNAFWDCARAPDPARGDAGARGQRRPDPPGAGEPAADDEGRLRRGRAGARRQRAPGRHPPRVPQRAGPGGHRRRPAVRDPARRRDPHRGDVQLAGDRRRAGPLPRTTATTSRCRGSSRCSRSRWWSSRC